jgi:hypothetical protein
MAASGWAREARTDETGTFEAEFPWKGSYAIEVSHADPTPGNRGGQAFELTLTGRSGRPHLRRVWRHGIYIISSV